MMILNYNQYLRNINHYLRYAMKIIIAIDSFKGCLTSTEVNEAVLSVVENIFPSAKKLTFPIADGGEGMQEVLITATQGKRVSLNVHNPLMQVIQADYGLSKDGKTAFIEMAAASGLPLVARELRNPLNTTTYGTGEQIRNALEQGCRNFIIGLGGSATNDAGLGMLQALGYRFYDKNNAEITEVITGKHLNNITRIEMSSALSALKEATFTAACDVRNPFFGKNGAAHIFASQKGANKEEIDILDNGLMNISNVIKEATGIDVSLAPGAGAAGGMGGGIMAFLHATLKPGIDLLLEFIRFEEQIKETDLIITGEGKADKQTLMGKVPHGILNIAKRHNIPTILIAGRVEDKSILKEAGFMDVVAITPAKQSLEEAMRPEVAKENIRRTLLQLFSHS